MRGSQIVYVFSDDMASAKICIKPVVCVGLRLSSRYNTLADIKALHRARNTSIYYSGSDADECGLHSSTHLIAIQKNTKSNCIFQKNIFNDDV